MKFLCQSFPNPFPRQEKRRAWKSAKHLLRALLSWPLAQTWLTYLNTDAMKETVRVNPRLHRKLQRVYLSRRWNEAQRLLVLQEHYDFMRDRLPGVWRTQVVENGGLILAAIPGAGGVSYQVRLRPEVPFEKEGELALTLIQTPHQGRLAAVALTVARAGQDRPALFIGCIQGEERGLPPESTKHAAKDLHGLRPKNLLILVVQQLAGQWGLDAIRAAGNSIHVYRSWRFAFSSIPGKVHLDYDAFWIEMGGRPDREGFFSLPLQTPRRTREEMKPNKRPMYARRYAMLDELEGALRVSVPEAKPIARPFPATPRTSSAHRYRRLRRTMRLWRTTGAAAALLVGGLILGNRAAPGIAPGRFSTKAQGASLSHAATDVFADPLVQLEGDNPPVFDLSAWDIIDDEEAAT